MEGVGAARANWEIQYTRAKISVWWHLENCPVPKDVDPYDISLNILSALDRMNYHGPIEFFCYADTTLIPHHVQNALFSSGIHLNHVSSSEDKDASFKTILVDLHSWASNNPAPANYLLISGDSRFSNSLHSLGLWWYNILLAQPQNVPGCIIEAAKNVWLWSSLVAGGLPLSDEEYEQLVNSSLLPLSDEEYE